MKIRRNFELSCLLRFLRLSDSRSEFVTSKLQDNPPPPPAPNTPPIRNSVVDDHEFLEKRLLEIKLKEQQKELEQDQRWLNEEASFPQLGQQGCAPTQASQAKATESNGTHSPRKCPCVVVVYVVEFIHIYTYVGIFFAGQPRKISI